jgi:hypothetical protein
MRRILTAAEIALDAQRDEHRKKWMGRIGKAQTGAELEAVLSKVTAMEGNPVETNTTRRLPKRYLEQYREIIQPLVILGWSLEEIREVLQRVSARRITHQLVLTYVEKISAENHESDIAEAIKAGRRVKSSAERREIIAESDRRTTQLLAAAPSTEVEQSTNQIKSVWDDFPKYDYRGFVVDIYVDPQGGLIIKQGKLDVSLKAVVANRLVGEITPKVSQDPEGEKLLKTLAMSSKSTIHHKAELSDAMIYLFYVMNQPVIQAAGSSKSKAVNAYFEEIKQVPFVVMQWTVMQLI